MARPCIRGLLLAATLIAVALAPAPARAALEAPLPVLLVHGWHGISDDSLEGSSLAPLGRRLAADGHEVVWAAGIGRDPTETLDVAAATLGAQVAALSARTGRPVAIVAHSYGGIVSRAYLEGERYASDFASGVRVASLTTLGAPMAGIDLWLPLLMVLGDPLREPSVWQLTPAWMAAFNAAHRPRPDVRLVTIAGDAREQAWLLRLLPPSDGVVTLKSALALDPARFGHAERQTGDVHSPAGPFAALGWHDFMSHEPTYRDAIRPALRGLGEALDGWRGDTIPPSLRGRPEPATSYGSFAWTSPDMARGPVVSAGARGARFSEVPGYGPETGVARFIAAPSAVPQPLAPARPAAPSASSSAKWPSEGARGLAEDPLAAAIAAAGAGSAFDAGILPRAVTRAAILAAPAGGVPPPPPPAGSAWFSTFPREVAHPVVRVTAHPGGLSALVTASDGRPLAPEDVQLDLVGALGAPIALVAKGNGALAGEVALPPGSYAVRAGLMLDGRTLEALVSASVPFTGGFEVLGGTWCRTSADAVEARAALSVAERGRYLVAVGGLDGAGREVTRTAGWRALERGTTAVALAAIDGSRPVARLVVAAFRDGVGLVPYGEAIVPAGHCAAHGPVADGRPADVADGPAGR